MSYEASFDQQLKQVTKNYRLRGGTCAAVKQGLRDAVEARQRIILVASGEYADSSYAVRAERMIEHFFKQIDRKCGCSVSRKSAPRRAKKR
ncbi:MAG: hypothetical protein ACRCSL_04830 [Microbacterium sp.]